ncbi:hypothetical protein ACQ4PT_047994 [Festuca glaucescens]
MDKCDMSSPAAKATSSSSHRYPSWVMLDRNTRLNYPRSTLDYPKDLFRLTIADAETSEGDPIRVAFRAVPPPGASRIYARWTPSNEERRRTQENPSYRVEPLVVTADGNVILLQLALHFDFETTRSDFYIYTVDSDGRPPSLRRFPTCVHEMAVDGLYYSRLEHMLRLTDIGLICRGDGEFVVADLQLRPEDDDVDGAPLEAQLCMLSERPELRYVRLPVRIPSGNPADRELGTRGCPHAFRNVCATEGGAVVRFVEVLTTTVFVSGCNSPVSSSFAINLWKLVTATLTWEKENTMEEAELWNLQGYGDLPRVEPESPVVSMEEPNVVYLVLDNKGDGRGGPDDVIIDDTRIIVVDMLNKTLRSWFKYTKVNPSQEEDGNMASRNLAGSEAFILCEFSKYLHVPQTSR